MITHYAETEERAREVAQALLTVPLPFTMTVTSGSIKRTVKQNALLHGWFGEIARHYGDRDAKQVKGECHHAWALDIKLRNPQWAWVWQRSGDALTYEQQCSLLASGVLGVSSTMSTKELTEYMDALARHYRAEGVALTDPEMQGLEQR